MIPYNSRWLRGFVAALMFFVPRGAQAQTARSFEELQGVLKAEEIVVVIDKTGQETRGKVAEVSASSLVLLVPEKTSSGLDTYTGAKRSFVEGTVAQIFDSDLSGRRGRRIYLALARSFQDLQQTLKVGQMVEVTDDTSQKTKGKMAAITGSSLVVLATGTRTFTEGTVTEVRVADPLSNGAWIGVGVGVGVAFFPAFYAAYAYGESKNGDGTAAALFWVPLLAAGAGGAAIGARLDASRIRGPAVYVSPQRTQRVKLSPVLEKDRQGVLVSVRF